MRKRTAALQVLTGWMLMGAPLAADQPALLKNTDVTKVMGEILGQHLGQKTMNEELIRHSFQVYINQFDPNRIYLYKSEAAPYISLTDPQVKQILQEYDRNKFSKYEELNNVIQKAILRARENRKQLMTNIKGLFAESFAVEDAEDVGGDVSKRAFAATAEELKQKQKASILKFIAAERDRFGDQVDKNPEKTLLIYERNARGLENTYLVQDDRGAPLSKEQQENLFVIHVLKALAASLDSHTSFLAPSEAYDMRMRLEKSVEGIGVVLQKKSNGDIAILKIIDGGPAAKSGKVEAGDVILTVNGQAVKGVALEEVLDMIRGANGSTLSLELKPVHAPIGGAVKTVELKRAAIAVNEDRAEFDYVPYEDGIIGIIKLQAFYQGDNGVTSEADIRRAIEQLRLKGKLKGVVLDLRQNSGGFLSQAVKVAGLFITNGVVVISKYSGGDEKFYRDMDGKVAFEGPLVVLTSKATASAAEIVSQALQDYGVALIVGDEQTYGKGTIQSQTVTENQGSSFFKVTVGKYYTVSGKTPQIQGVKADIVVPSQFGKEKIGEAYLNYAVDKDTIPAAYEDPLQDIDPSLKGWYKRYYTPTLQKRQAKWQQYMPTLKANSAKRLKESPIFQAYFSNRLNNPQVIEDSQLAEAVHIVEDMIDLDSKSVADRQP